MSTWPTAEQILKDEHPRILRVAVLLALLIHAVAFVATPSFTVEPYRLREDGPPPITPVVVSWERSEPLRPAPKPPAVREFAPSMDANADATIDGTSYDPLSAAPVEPVPLGTPRVLDVFEVPPKLVLRIRPVYPELAQQAELEGVVGLLIVVDEAGNVVSADVVRSVPGLDRAAIDAILQWKYEPALQRDVPVRVRIFQSVRFRLRD